MSDVLKSCLLVGDYAHAEFAAAVDWLRTNTNLTLLPDLAAAREHSTPLVVVAQSRPNQFPAASLEAFRSAVPSRQVVVLSGTWCEGETRAAPETWPKIPRVFWHEAQTRLAEAVGGESTSIPAAKPGELLAVYAANWLAFDALADVCESLGYAVVWANRLRTASLRGATAVLWEGDVRHVAELESLVRNWSPKPVVALAPFVRVDEPYRRLVAGAVARPTTIEGLGRELRRVIDARGPRVLTTAVPSPKALRTSAPGRIGRRRG